VAVGVDGFSEGRDAVVLGEALARAAGAELMLVEVHSAPLFPYPGWDWKSMRRSAELQLREARQHLAPEARTAVETGGSIPHALDRVMRRWHHDLLVVGSSREGPRGHVRIGKRTRELLSNFPYSLAVAPRGLHSQGDVKLERIGVGYDSGPESAAALAVAGAIAARGGAQLLVKAIVDDRIPVLLRSAVSGMMATEWTDAIRAEEERLQKEAHLAAGATRAKATVEVARGRPASALLDVSEDIDLLVIGSRRWGRGARVLLGSTGEALMHDAACPVLAVPRPGK
jgi:nucleotide-binding universal stress UspA family protein